MKGSWRVLYQEQRIIVISEAHRILYLLDFMVESAYFCIMGEACNECSIYRDHGKERYSSNVGLL